MFQANLEEFAAKECPAEYVRWAAAEGEGLLSRTE